MASSREARLQLAHLVTVKHVVSNDLGIPCQGSDEGYKQFPGFFPQTTIALRSQSSFRCGVFRLLCEGNETIVAHMNAQDITGAVAQKTTETIREVSLSRRREADEDEEAYLTGAHPRRHFVCGLGMLDFMPVRETIPGNSRRSPPVFECKTKLIDVSREKVASYLSFTKYVLPQTLLVLTGHHTLGHLLGGHCLSLLAL